MAIFKDLYVRLGRRRNLPKPSTQSQGERTPQSQTSRYAWLTTIFSSKTLQNAVPVVKEPPIILPPPESRPSTSWSNIRPSLELQSVSPAWQLRRGSELKRISAASMIFSEDIRSPRPETFQYVPLMIDLDSLTTIDCAALTTPMSPTAPAQLTFNTSPVKKFFIDAGDSTYFAPSPTSQIITVPSPTSSSSSPSPCTIQSPAPRFATEFPRTHFSTKKEHVSRLYGLRKKCEEISKVEVVHAKARFQNNFAKVKGRGHNVAFPSRARCSISGTPRRFSASTAASRPGTAGSDITVSSLQAQVRICLRRPDTAWS